MAQNITFEILLDYVDGRLDSPTRTVVEALLARDARLSADAALLRRVIGLMRADDSADAPVAVITRAVRIMRQRSASRPRETGLFRRVIATLLSDSGARPTFGVRASGAASNARQMLFASEGVEFDVRVTPGLAGFDISGQALDEDFGGRVMLVGDDATYEAALSPLGEFRIGDVPAGRYVLMFRHGNVEHVLPALDLSA